MCRGGSCNQERAWERIAKAHFPARGFKADDAPLDFLASILIFRVLPKETQARSQFGTPTQNIQEFGISDNIVRLAMVSSWRLNDTSVQAIKPLLLSKHPGSMSLRGSGYYLLLGVVSGTAWRCRLQVVRAPAMPSHDVEFGDRGLMPVFDFAQNRFEIFADRQPAFACNRDRRRRHVVGEFSPRPGLAGRLEIDDHRVGCLHPDMYSNEHI